MFKKEQQRPTQQEFEAAALRLEDNNYPEWWESSIAVQAIARCGSMFTFRPAPERRISMKRHDYTVIALEQKYEGYLIGEEQLTTFAKNQLARYRALKKY